MVRKAASRRGTSTLQKLVIASTRFTCTACTPCRAQTNQHRPAPVYPRLHRQQGSQRGLRCAVGLPTHLAALPGEGPGAHAAEQRRIHGRRGGEEGVGAGGQVLGHLGEELVQVGCVQQNARGSGWSAVRLDPPSIAGQPPHAGSASCRGWRPRTGTPSPRAPPPAEEHPHNRPCQLRPKSPSAAGCKARG